MRNEVKKIYTKLEGINGIFLFFYAAVAVMPLLFDMVTALDIPIKLGLILILCVLGGLLWLCPVVIRRVRNLAIIGKQKENRHIFYWSVLFFVICLAVLLIWYAGYYPGFFFSDIKDQLDQAVSGHYNDWHPVLQTILTFTLPLKITGGWVGSIILFQMVLFSATVSYMASVILRYGNWKFALGSVLFIVLNPITGKMCLYPLKDVTFAIWAVLLLAFAAQTYFSKGAWLNSPTHRICLICASAIATIVRHNGILFTLPLLLGVLFYTDKKRKFQILISVILLIVCVKGPVYAALHVEEPGQRQVEMLGMPLTIIGNVVVEHPEVLDEETQNLVYSIASQDNWEQYYVMGRFNTIKWAEGTNLDAIEEGGTFAVLKATWKCIWAAPVSSAKAFIALTKMVYTLDESSCFYELGIGLDEYEVAYGGNQQIMQCLESYTRFIYNSPFQYIFCYIGMMHLVMLIFILGKTRFGSVDDWKRLVICISVFAYDFGTMLLLSGRDDRFFYVSFMACPIVTGMMLLKEGGVSK